MPTSTDIAAAMKAAPSDEPIVEVDPSAMVLDAAGQCTRQWFARMPEGLVGGDLGDPAIWRRVQQDRDKALMVFDRLFLVGFDQTWFGEAVVTEVTATGGTLGMLKIAAVERRQKALMNDGVYEVRWNGRGYVVFRIKDGQPMTHPVQSELIANEELVRLYPRKAS